MTVRKMRLFHIFRPKCERKKKKTLETLKQYEEYAYDLRVEEDILRTLQSALRIKENNTFNYIKMNNFWSPKKHHNES